MSHKVTICLEQLKALEHSTIATALIRTYLQQKNWQPSVSQYIPEHRNRTEQQEIIWKCGKNTKENDIWLHILKVSMNCLQWIEQHWQHSIDTVQATQTYSRKQGENTGDLIYSKKQWIRFDHCFFIRNFVNFCRQL